MDEVWDNVPDVYRERLAYEKWTFLTQQVLLIILVPKLTNSLWPRWCINGIDLILISINFWEGISNSRDSFATFPNILSKVCQKIILSDLHVIFAIIIGVWKCSQIWLVGFDMILCTNKTKFCLGIIISLCYSLLW